MLDRLGQRIKNNSIVAIAIGRMEIKIGLVLEVGDDYCTVDIDQQDQINIISSQGVIKLPAEPFTKTSDVRREIERRLAEAGQ
jgi:hypothetical protein